MDVKYCNICKMPVKDIEDCKTYEQLEKQRYEEIPDPRDIPIIAFFFGGRVRKEVIPDICEECTTGLVKVMYEFIKKRREATKELRWSNETW